MSDSDESWLTYAEAGRALGISPEAVRARSKRLGWPHRLPNAFGAPTRIQIPNEFRAVRPVTEGHARSVVRSKLNRSEPADTIARAVRAGVEAAFAPVLALVDRAEQRAVKLEQERDAAIAAERAANQRFDEARTCAAERLAEKDATITGLVAEKQVLKQEVETLTGLLAARRSWWRRVFGR